MRAEINVDHPLGLMILKQTVLCSVIEFRIQYYTDAGTDRFCIRIMKYRHYAVANEANVTNLLLYYFFHFWFFFLVFAMIKHKTQVFRAWSSLFRNNIFS